MDCAWVSSGTKLCFTFCTTFSVTAHLHRVWYLMKFPRCNNGTSMQSHRPCCTGTKGKVTTFLNESPLRKKPGLAHTNQTWNANEMNGSIPVLLIQKTCAPHHVLWRWCSLWRRSYNIDGIILHHAVPPRKKLNAADYCTFLQHHLRPALRRKRNLVVQNPHHSSWQYKESHSCCCDGPLAPLDMGDSATYTAPIRWVHAITISSPKWKHNCEGSGTTQEMNLSVLQDDQYGKSKMDALVMYDTFQILTKGDQ